MTGVVTMPPSAPRLVIVIVEPVSSSSVTLAAARGLERRVTSAARGPQVAGFGVLDDGHHQSRGGLHGDAEVDGAVPLDDAVLVVEPGVHLRVVADGDDDGAHQERQHRQPRCAVTSVHLGAQLVERGDVDLLDVGEVGDPPLGGLHALGDVAPQPDDLDLFDLVAARPARPGPDFGRRDRRGRRARSRPSGPLPRTPARSTPNRAARARTAGAAVAAARSTPFVVGGAGSPGAVMTAGSGAGGGAASASAATSVSMRTMSAPTATMSPTSAPSQRTTPCTGDGSSTVALSVITSTRTSSSLIESPTLTCHSTISASATPSPTSGSWIT